MRAFLGIKDRAQNAVISRKSALNSRLTTNITPTHDAQKWLGSQHERRSSSPSDSPVDPTLEHLLLTARSDAVRKEFLAELDPEALIDREEVQLLVATYNVNGRHPAPELDLSKWLAVTPAIEVVIVGFQEIVPLSANNVLNDLMGANGDNTAAWDKLTERALHGRNVDSGSQKTCNNGHLLPSAAAHTSNDHNEKDSETQTVADASDAFLQVAAKQMVGIYLSIWVRSSRLSIVRGVQVTSVGTGVMGVLGNKGAVTARLRLCDTGLTVVVAHLSSGEASGDEARRNYDYAEILRRTAFPPESATISPEALSAAAAQGVTKVAEEVQRPGQWGDARGIMDAQHSVWLGDLNYRLTGVSDGQARELLGEGKLRDLAAYDELALMRHTGLAFQEWEEGPLTFPPTFKLQRGTLKYNGSTDQAMPSMDSALRPPPLEPEQKIRKPAWTDRVLWRCLDGNDTKAALQLQSYRSVPLTASDHLPVAAHFVLPVMRYNRMRVEAAIEAARRRVDAAEMASIPRCTLDPPCVDIGNLRLGQCGEATAILRNTGSVTALFTLQQLPGAMLGDSKDRNLRTAPRWASVSPQQGLLEPGDSIDIQIVAMVTIGLDGTAEAVVSEKHCRLDAELVLRISGGNDLFLAIAGSYQPSFLGLSFSTLSSLPRPLVQHASGGSPDDTAKTRANKADEAHCSKSAVVQHNSQNSRETMGNNEAAELKLVPPEIRMLTNFLRRPDSLSTPGLFKGIENVLNADERHKKVRKEIREALEEESCLLQQATPHDVAAILLAVFACLPTTFMPAAISQQLEGPHSTAEAAVALLADSMGAVDLAVCHHMLSLCSEALLHNNANGLSPSYLAALLAEAWFGSVVLAVDSAGAFHSKAELTLSPHVKPLVPEINEQQAAFIRKLLNA